MLDLRRVRDFFMNFCHKTALYFRVKDNKKFLNKQYKRLLRKKFFYLMVMPKNLSNQKSVETD